MRSVGSNPATAQPATVPDGADADADDASAGPTGRSPGRSVPVHPSSPPVSATRSAASSDLGSTAGPRTG
ncbi:hypothetical protein ASG49_15070 [Marmoricola sp. Leaf446]|nr:hypothetical protein ASG49_15070 [Marmoricola sp. Leaf446]